ncbi:hypothetical protein M9458_043260 [Cirrhinus mrigala]|uniref:SGNH hydrolase-type esterase domain-containing protein n=1 Tax=Cirrhinus mrigala TaxID=683832 RepID=A0ABD0NDE8_CIRMR
MRSGSAVASFRIFTLRKCSKIRQQCSTRFISRKTRARPRPRTSPPPPPPVFEISTRNHFAPLRETERDAVIVGDSIVRYVRATLTKDTAILKDGESVGAIVLHAGVNDTKLRQTEVLKRDFSSLIETVRSTSPATRIVVSGPLPTYRRGHERLFRADGLHPSSERSCCRTTSPGRYAPFD